MVCRSREKEHQVGLQFVQRDVRNLQWFNIGRAIAMKRDVVQSSERRSEFILLADVTSEDVARNVKCFFRQIMLGKMHLQIRRDGLEHVDADAGGGTEAG